MSMPLVKLPAFILRNTELSVPISFGARTVIIKIVKAVNKFMPEITCPYNHFYYRSVILSIIYHICQIRSGSQYYGVNNPLHHLK